MGALNRGFKNPRVACGGISTVLISHLHSEAVWLGRHLRMALVQASVTFSVLRVAKPRITLLLNGNQLLWRLLILYFIFDIYFLLCIVLVEDLSELTLNSLHRSRLMKTDMRQQKTENIENAFTMQGYLCQRQQMHTIPESNLFK
jgi:hypothetical protein